MVKKIQVLFHYYGWKSFNRGLCTKGHALFNHYSAIEYDSSLSLEYRESQMQEWWKT